MPQFLGTPVDDAFFTKATEAAIDITSPELVEATFDIKKGVLWVNVNGLCVLRCCRIKELHFGSTPMFKDRSYEP